MTRPKNEAVAAPNAAIVDELCRHFQQRDPGEAQVLCQFAREMLARTPRQALATRSTEELVALILAAFRFMEKAPEEGVTVQISDPAEEGWSGPFTIIRATLSDRPFIVDTVREFLSGEQIPILYSIYPIISFERDGEGRIVGVTGSAGDDPRSLLHYEVPRIEEADRRAQIAAEIERRLADVIRATEDFQPMLRRLATATSLIQGYAEQFPDRRAELEEVDSFLHWLGMENFVFLGYRAYDIAEENGQTVVRVEPGSGLGILRDEAQSSWAEGIRVDELPAELRRRVVEGPILITSKTNARSTVHRRGRMDYIGVKKLDESGRVIGEHRFLGLFTSKAYTENAETIPILRRKLQGILQASGAKPGSHDYKEIITIFNSMPKEDLFQASLPELDEEVRTVVSLLFSDEVQVYLRPDPLERGVSVMVILPRGQFSGDVRNRIQDVLTSTFDGVILNYYVAMGAGDQARLHFYVSSSPDRVRTVTADQISLEVRRVVRSWDDELADQLAHRTSPAEAQSLALAYANAFQDDYRAATSPAAAADDLEELERLRSGDAGASIRLRAPLAEELRSEGGDFTILKLYMSGDRLVLSDFMPVLDNAGLRVINVTPFEIGGDTLPRMMIYSFAVQDPDRAPINPAMWEALSEGLLAIRDGETSNDPFNALILRAGLRWREVDVLRMYANYTFQAGLSPTRFAAARALGKYPALATLLMKLFSQRFDPSAPEPTGRRSRKSTPEEEIAGEIVRALESVKALAEDRAIRRIMTLMRATTRTNYFLHGGANPTRRSGGVPYISVKIAVGELEDLRKNRLLYEIFVYSVRMEGIHLRGASVSRGGIRWSDRPDDYRTEVLGLVRTQVVKNAVIVPSGSKGGFITRRSMPDRDAMMQEMAEQYRTLIRGMLDITDNIVDGTVVPPPGVVRHDSDDPYLVVAADKGTAHLSDVANGVAAEYGFWLGDAFASGGSFGYDHKEEGITARGAWECVRRHFREMGKDIQSEPFTVAGIGDMSGDVFGNGMLLSRQIKLVAAFDHRHIFIDPSPDPESSFIERERLFKLPRSSWDDYDRSKLSPGAMIVPRASKEIEITPEARVVLGIAEESDSSLDGEALIRAVLSAPVELLWNGGIGTYVKDQEESNSEVGDTGNDAVRVDATDLRCKVIGEGGNLGMTQRARISYALRGGRLNTDALDNSAGVDMSDHEVNLKILVAPLVASGALPVESRNALLEGMTDEVSRLVLKNNITQSLAVSLDEIRSREALADLTSLITSLERDKLLDRVASGIPSTEEIESRAKDGVGLTRPTLCVLLAYAKLSAQAHLLASPLPDDAATEEYLINYFPRAAVDAVGMDVLRAHRLRREIVATELVNELVDEMGAAFLDRVARETGMPHFEVASAWFIASRIAGAPEIRADLEGLQGSQESQAIYRWMLGLSRVLERTTRWVLASVEPGVPIQSVISDLRGGLSQLRGSFGRIVTGADRAIYEERLAEIQKLGVDVVLAERLITLRFLPELLDILRIAREASSNRVETGEAYYIVGEELGITWMQQILRTIARDDPWEKRLAQTLIADVQRSHRLIARRVLECKAEGVALTECMVVFSNQHLLEAEQYLEILRELRAVEQPPLAAFVVAVKSLLTLASS